MTIETLARKWLGDDDPKPLTDECQTRFEKQVLSAIAVRAWGGDIEVVRYLEEKKLIVWGLGG